MASKRLPVSGVSSVQVEETEPHSSVHPRPGRAAPRNTRSTRAVPPGHVTQPGKECLRTPIPFRQLLEPPVVHSGCGSPDVFRQVKHRGEQPHLALHAPALLGRPGVGHVADMLGQAGVLRRPLKLQRGPIRGVRRQSVGSPSSEREGRIWKLCHSCHQLILDRDRVGCNLRAACARPETEQGCRH